MKFHISCWCCLFLKMMKGWKYAHCIKVKHKKIKLRSYKNVDFKVRAENCPFFTTLEKDDEDEFIE